MSLFWGGFTEDLKYSVVAMLFHQVESKKGSAAPHLLLIGRGQIW